MRANAMPGLRYWSRQAPTANGHDWLSVQMSPPIVAHERRSGRRTPSSGVRVREEAGPHVAHPRAFVVRRARGARGPLHALRAGGTRDSLRTGGAGGAGRPLSTCRTDGARRTRRTDGARRTRRTDGARRTRRTDDAIRALRTRRTRGPTAPVGPAGPVGPSAPPAPEGPIQWPVLSMTVVVPMLSRSTDECPRSRRRQPVRTARFQSPRAASSRHRFPPSRRGSAPNHRRACPGRPGPSRGRPRSNPRRR